MDFGVPILHPKLALMPTVRVSVPVQGRSTGNASRIAARCCSRASLLEDRLSVLPGVRSEVVFREAELCAMRAVEAWYMQVL